jgi:hypothetical protein
MGIQQGFVTIVIVLIREKGGGIQLENAKKSYSLAVFR